MLKNEISSLTTLRPNKENNEIFNLEICDPEKDSQYVFQHSDLSEFEKIADILRSIKECTKNDHKSENFYNHWLNRGWHKSIDYYIASRSKSLIDQSNNFQLKETKNNCADSIGESELMDHVEKQFTVPQALLNRRSKRVFTKKAISQNVFYAGMANAAQSILNQITGFELYFIIYNVENISPSVSLYNFKKNTLLLVREGNFADDMSSNIQGLRTPKTAAFTIILVADFTKLSKLMPYPRGLRDVYIESGRLAQKILISYMQYGVFSLVTPALCDRPIVELLKLNEPDLSPLYSLTFGYPI